MKTSTILKHKLRTDSAATKFMQGSTSNQKLAVKSLAQNRLCLNKDEFLQNKLPHL